MKRIRFYLRCLKVVWNDRDSKSCRQKWRRLAKQFQKIEKEMGLSK